MNNILLEIFPEAVNNLIVRFNIHPVAEAFKCGIKTMKICHDEIQDVITKNQCSFSHAYFLCAYFQTYIAIQDKLEGEISDDERSDWVMSDEELSD